MRGGGRVVEGAEGEEDVAAAAQRRVGRRLCSPLAARLYLNPAIVNLEGGQVPGSRRSEHLYTPSSTRCWCGDISPPLDRRPYG